MRADHFAFFATKTPFIIAHRGGAGLWPENTALAYIKSSELGCRYFETDVHLTRDGHVVCIHDATLERTSNGRGFVRDYSLAEIKTLDAAYHFESNGTFPFRDQDALFVAFAYDIPNCVGNCQIVRFHFYDYAGLGHCIE